MQMNIVLVSYEFPPLNAIGGIGSYMYHLSVFLTSKGQKVTVFSANPGAVELSVFNYPHCVNYVIPSSNNDAFRNEVVPVFERFHKSNRVDVIESPEVGACALHVKEKFPHIPLVVKMHSPGVLITKVNNSYLPLKKKLRFVAGALMRGRLDAGFWASHDKNQANDLEYRICMIADTLLSPSMALKKWAVQFWGIRPERIKLLRNPFSVQDGLFSMPLNSRPNVISFVGKLSVLKGMLAFTKAIPMILKKNKGYKLLLVGRDEIENGVSMQEYMEVELTAYRTEIIFTGALDRDKLNEVYASSKVCVIPSLWENYPTVVMEAMAAGAAVAAADRGGIPELISHNVTGLLFDAMKPEVIARVVNDLLFNEEKRLAMVIVARQELLNNINSPQFENDLLQVYTQYKNCNTSS